jgi:two-component system, OmpR family, phosphate regulon sensor histidine kinase PhoR
VLNPRKRPGGHVDLYTMNRRIRSIFWLMTACIVAINAFQGYWLWTTYQLNRRQFAQTAQDALFQVVEGQQIKDASVLFGDSAVTGRYHAGERSRVLVKRDGVRSIHTNFFYKISVDTTRDIRVGKSADTLARRISNLVVRGWRESRRFDRPALDSAYRDELMRRGIVTPFVLDTLTIRPKTSEQNVLIFDNSGQMSETGNEVKTGPLPLNPVQHLFLQASFKTPLPYLLGRMAWLLGASGLLLLLTTGCFVWMLRTILKQKRLSEVKNDFINNMTHELKTPIATVTAAVEALMNFGILNDPQKTQDYLSISQNNLQRLSDLVEKVLNLAVEDKQEIELNRERVSLAEMISELAASHRVRAVKTVIFNMHIPFGATVEVDRMHFGNVLNNLIDNAIKYSHDRVTISFDFRQHPQGWQLMVADNGIGIPKAYQSSVFDRFFRVPTGDLHRVKGFGLGLAYARQVVEKHGGSISVASEPGKGSEFVLKF